MKGLSYFCSKCNKWHRQLNDDEALDFIMHSAFAQKGNPKEADEDRMY